MHLARPRNAFRDDGSRDARDPFSARKRAHQLRCITDLYIFIRWLHLTKSKIMLSKACEYGIRAIVHIAHKSMNDERVGLKAIAEAIDSPVAFTGKIMQQLTRSGVVLSVKGPSGGFWMDDALQHSVSIRDVVEIIDGDKLYVKCGLGLNQCSDANPCPVHNQYREIRDRVISMHTNTLIADLARKLDQKATLK